MKHVLVKSKYVSQAINWLKKGGKIFKELLVNSSGSQESLD